MEHFEVIPPQSFAGEFESGSEVFETLGESFEGEFGRRAGAGMRARPPARRLPPARRMRPLRALPPRRPKPRPPWPMWPPYGGGPYPTPIFVERPLGPESSTAEQQRCVQECLRRGATPPSAPPEPAAPGADAPPGADAAPASDAASDAASGDASAPAPASEFEGFGEFESQGEGEFEFETVAQAAARTAQRPGSASCTSYERGEAQKSTTALGHLAADVALHPRGLLIADFGVNWRTPREALKRDTVLKDWLKTIADVIRANPSTTIRILGFSDCIGTERNNRTLRRGRATRVLALLEKMAGRAAWPAVKAKIKLTDAAPAGDYVASNATVEGRARNRSVLIEHTRQIDFAPTVLKSCAISSKQAATYPLLGLIPNLPGRLAVPINYTLNAKKVIGEVAKDLSSRGKSAHFWVELAHAGLVAAEIFAEGSLIVAGLAIAGPLLGLAGSFLAIGAGYYEAGEKIAEEWSASGYARGLVMGAEGKKQARRMNEFFGNACCPPNHFFPKGRDIAIANYRMGLLVGYVHGRLLCPNQRALFWRDLGARMGDQSYRGPQQQWTQRGWVDWYISAAATFRKAHLR